MCQSAENAARARKASCQQECILVFSKVAPSHTQFESPPRILVSIPAWKLSQQTSCHVNIVCCEAIICSCSLRAQNFYHHTPNTKDSLDFQPLRRSSPSSDDPTTCVVSTSHFDSISAVLLVFSNLSTSTLHCAFSCFSCACLTLPLTVLVSTSRLLYEVWRASVFLMC